MNRFHSSSENVTRRRLPPDCDEIVRVNELRIDGFNLMGKTWRPADIVAVTGQPRGRVLPEKAPDLASPLRQR